MSSTLWETDSAVRSNKYKIVTRPLTRRCCSSSCAFWLSWASTVCFCFCSRRSVSMRVCPFGWLASCCSWAESTNLATVSGFKKTNLATVDGFESTNFAAVDGFENIYLATVGGFENTNLATVDGFENTILATRQVWKHKLGNCRWKTQTCQQ